MVVDLHGYLLWARRRGKHSVSFVIYERVKRRLDNRPRGGNEKSDNRDSSYAYTGRIHISALRFIDLERHCHCGSGQKGDKRKNYSRMAGSLLVHLIEIFLFGLDL